MEQVQSLQRPLAYHLAKSVAFPKENQIDSAATLNLTGSPDCGGDVVYDF